MKDNDNKNFIDISDNLDEKQFIIDYSYQFIKLAFLNLIYKIPSSTTIDVAELTESGIGPLLENKIKRYIENLEDPHILIRYFWNFTRISKIYDKKLPEEKYDFSTFRPLVYDDIIKYKITDNDRIYYIIPGSQTNRSLDSIMLIPIGGNEFNMICFQITKHKMTIKEKKDYSTDCFIAKSKFEESYGIKIKNVYFYFILAEDYMNEDTKNSLDINNISYFYFSIRKVAFIKNDEIIQITDLCNPEAEITQVIENNEYRTFENKNELIKITENFLIKKRKRDINFKISETIYEKARKYLFRLSSHISLDQDIEKEMRNIVNKAGKKKNFIFTYVFNVNFSEYTDFLKHIDLIGVIIDENGKKEKERSYHYYYQGQLYPQNSELDVEIYSKMVNKKERTQRLIERKNNYLLKEVPSKFCNSIFVFKIYEINKI